MSRGFVRKVSILFLLILLLTLTGCGKEKYYIPKFVLDAIGQEASEYSESIKKEYIYDGKYEDIYADKEGNLVYVANEEQQKATLEIMKGDLDFYVYRYTKWGFTVDYNEKFTEVILQCKKDEFGTGITEEDIKFFVIQLSGCQALTGVKPEDLYVHGYIKDIETGEVLYEYILTSEE